MAFTLEEAYQETKELYHLRLLAGKEGLKNSISWVYQLEDSTVIHHFWGKELVVTMGIRFQTTRQLYHLISDLMKQNASGLIINTGKYIADIPGEIIDFCNANDFPLLTVPWEIFLADLIKDFCIRSVQVELEENKISAALISALEHPDAPEAYEDLLKKEFETGYGFQIVLLSTHAIDQSSPINTRHIHFQMKVLLDRFHFPCHFFYYQKNYVLVFNTMRENSFLPLLSEILTAAHNRFPDQEVFIGIGTAVGELSELHTSYKRAHAALQMGFFQKTSLTKFSDMGIYQILFSLDDRELLKDMYEQTLLPLCEYDNRHHSSLEDTLYHYLKYDGSLRQVSEATFTHRNTVLYRVKKIKELLGTELDTPAERFPYQMAFYIRDILRS